MSPKNHLRAFRSYLYALVHDGVALMSGIASVILGWWFAYHPPTNDKLKALLWLTTAICFVIASYRVWLKAHKAQADAEARLGRPLLTGFFQDISTSYIYDEAYNQNPLGFGGKILGSKYAITVRIMNESPVPTTLHNFSLLVESQGKQCVAQYPAEEWIPPPQTWRPKWLMKQESKLPPQLVTLLGSDKTITQGVGIDGILVFDLPGWGIDTETSLPDPPASEEGVPIFLTLAIEDAWGAKHIIKDRWGPPPPPSRRLNPDRYYFKRNTK